MEKTLESYVLERIETLEKENALLRAKNDALQLELNESTRKLLVVANHLEIKASSIADRNYIVFNDYVWNDEKDFATLLAIIGGNQ